MKDKVEVFDFDKYNFVTPIMKPAAMERGELLDRVMNNYRRFYFKKALFHYPWAGTGARRRYLLGCLKAFLKSGFERKFYDLGKVGYWGPQSKKKVIDPPLIDQNANTCIYRHKSGFSALWDSRQ